MAECNEASGAAGFAAHNKAGKQIAEWLLQVEAPLLLEEHGKGCCNDDLGQAGDVVDCVRLDCGRVRLIGEAADAVDRDWLACCEHTKGAAGKGMRGDCVAEDTASATEVEFLYCLRHSDLWSIVAEDAGIKVED